jgi:hypothetical protein
VILKELVARGPPQSANEAGERLRHAGVVAKLAQALVRQHEFTEAASQLVGALDELEASSRTATHPVTKSSERCSGAHSFDLAKQRRPWCS